MSLKFNVEQALNNSSQKAFLMKQLGLVCLFLSCLVVNGSLTASDDATRPNVLWIYVDDMSDWLSCYGDNTIKTPNIDRLAEDGVRFENAFMPSPVCSTTRSAIITGQLQTSLGLHHHRTMIKLPLPKDVQTVPEVFRRAGYLTFNEAKEDYNFVRSRQLMYSSELRRPKVKAHFGGGNTAWMKQLKGKPFFGQIQLKGGKIGGETGAKFPTESRIDPSKVSVPPQYPDDPVFRDAIARHYEQILQTDKIVGDIVQGLKEHELWENTIVFFFTDHGSPLPRSKQFLYDEGIKVPLIVRFPSSLRKHAKTAIRKDLASGIDISASSLGLCGLDIPPSYEGRDLFATNYQPRRYLVTARDRCGIAVDRIRCVRTDKYHYIRNFKTDRALFQSNYRDKYATFTRLGELLNEGKLSKLQASYMDSKSRPAEELYSVEDDPQQLHNLATNIKFNKELERHRELLKKWEVLTGDQGQQKESNESLERVFKGAKGKVTAPEFDFLKK